MSDYNEKLREDFGRRAKAATQAVADAGITGKDLERFEAQMAVINGIIDDNGLMSEAMSALETLELMASNLTSAPAPTGGTPVPAPAAPQPMPATPTAPPSGTRQWAPSQATPPKHVSSVTPVVPPSSPEMDLESMKLDIASAVKDGVIELLTPMAQVLPSDNTGFLPVASKAAVDELDERVKVLETSSKDMSFGGWLSASITTIVVGVIAFWVMTIGQMGDTIKFVAAPLIGVGFGFFAMFIANAATAKRARSSRNAA